ncbi:hypothetical protein SO802_021711 [Lithocarpus litseifolius]|uniref:NB-ARC domain-containing protein n=1 Tax=Lithocarpus litseifolius TaxID=425828 RepID=A0AAW2CFR0_9ROSI
MARLQHDRAPNLATFVSSLDATIGSRVILTTRHFNVASEADPWSSQLNLRQLTEEESWVLFLKNVGSRRSPENSSDLKQLPGRNFGNMSRFASGGPPTGRTIVNHRIK